MGCQNNNKNLLTLNNKSNSADVGLVESCITESVVTLKLWFPIRKTPNVRTVSEFLYSDFNHDLNSMITSSKALITANTICMMDSITWGGGGALLCNQGYGCASETCKPLPFADQNLGPLQPNGGKFLKKYTLKCQKMNF